MRSKALTIRASQATPEIRANCCQLSGHSSPCPNCEAHSKRARSAIWRNLIILLCVLCTPCASFAKTAQASWENLSALTAGQKVQVVDLHAKKFSGTFVNFSPTSISLQQQSGAQTILRQDIASVTLMENHHRMRNALIGFGVGTGAGIGIGAATYHKCTATGFACAGYHGEGLNIGVGAVFGGAAGAVVGALWPSHKNIFRASAAN